MSDSDLKIIGKFQKAVDAHMARSYLEQHGIEAFVHDEYVNRIAFYSTGIFGGVKLRVKAVDYDQALELLQKVNERELEVVDEDYTPKNKPLSRMDILKSIFILILVAMVLVYLYLLRL